VRSQNVYKTQVLSVVIKLTAYGLEVRISFTDKGRDRLCGLVVKVLGYRSGGPGSISSTAAIKKK
jgi:hypothetical protein